MQVTRSKCQDAGTRDKQGTSGCRAAAAEQPAARGLTQESRGQGLESLPMSKQGFTGEDSTQGKDQEQGLGRRPTLTSQLLRSELLGRGCRAGPGRAAGCVLRYSFRRSSRR